MFEIIHLQWFGDPPPAPPPAGDSGKPGEPGEGEPAGNGETGSLTAAPWLSQASDKYKRDEKFLQDLLKGPKAVKSWSDVLDRMYAGEKAAGEHQAAAAELQAKLSAEQDRAAELAKGADQAPELKLEDYKLKLPPVPPFMQDPAFRAYNETLGEYLEDAATEIKAVAVELQLPIAAAQRMVELFVKRQTEAFRVGMTDTFTRREKAVAALKAEWKGDFAANEELAKRALRTFGGVPLAHQIAVEGFADSPTMLKIFRNIGAAMGEGHLVPGRPGLSPEGAVSGSGEKARPDLKKRYGRSPELFGTGGR